MILEHHPFYSFQPDSIEVVHQEQNHPSRPEVRNKFSKILFFTLREGAIRTFRKIRSKRIQDKIETQTKLVLASYHIPDTQFSLIAVGNLWNTDSPQLTFHQELTAILRDQYFQDAFTQIKNKLSEDKKFLSELSTFNSFSGLAPSIRLSSVFKEQWLAKNTNVENLFSNQFPELVSAGIKKSAAKRNLYLVGGGDYTRTYILSNINQFNHESIFDHNFAAAQYVAKQYGFNSFGVFYNSALEKISNDERPVVIIASYHSTHTPIGLDILGKNSSAYIFIEKPPLTSEEQLRNLLTVYDQNQIFIGYNRRHIPWVQEVDKKVAQRNSPVFINMTVKEVRINENHWYYWPNQGTRITGNLCHWIDLAVYWVKATPASLSLTKGGRHDDLTLTIRFEDGSLVNIFSTEAGNSLRGVQEKIEIRFDETTIFIDDFLKMVVLENGKKSVKRKLRRDKGHDRMYQYFQNAVIKGKPDIYSRRDLILSSLIYLKASEMFLNGIPYLELDYSGYF